jgi:uncharacterized protein YndB with AHSA1/START domain
LTPSGRGETIRAVDQEGEDGMAAIVNSVEIARSPEDVFAYVADLAAHGEWQERILETKVETEGPTRLGSRATDTRKVPGGKREVTYEIVEWDPPRRFGFKGVGGPIRPDGRVTVEPVDDGARARITLELDFTGHGFGKVLLPFVRRDAGKEVPQAQAKLKERLESGAE